MILQQPVIPFFRIVLFLLTYHIFFISTAQQEQVDSLKKILENQITERKRLEVLFTIAQIEESEFFDFGEAFLYYDRVRRLSKKVRDTTFLGKAVFNQGKMLLAMEDYEYATFYFEKILEKANKDRCPKLAIKGYTGKGLLNFKKENYKESIIYFDMAIQIEKDQRDYQNLAELFFLKSEAHWKDGDVENATVALARAYEINKEEETPIKYILHKAILALEEDKLEIAEILVKRVLFLAEKEENYYLQLKAINILIGNAKKAEQWEEADNWELKKEAIAEEAPRLLSKEHVNEVNYAHAYDIAVHQKEQIETKYKLKTNLLILAFLVFGSAIGAYLFKRQRKINLLLKSIREAQINFVQEKQKEYNFKERLSAQK